MSHKHLFSGLLLTLSLGLPAWAASSLPPALQQAEELAPAGSKHWLAVDGQGLALLDAQGREQARIKLRAEHLDSRMGGAHGQTLAVVQDADTQETLILQVQEEQGRLTTLARLPSPSMSVETLCLYRDQQQFHHLFLLGKDGQAEQWLLSGPQPRLLRRLAVPPGVEHCQANDQTGTLYLSEPGFGLWAYQAEGEGIPERQLLAARKPWGDLVKGASALTLLPGGLALLDGKGKELQVLEQGPGGWKLKSRTPVKKGEALAYRNGLLLRDSSGWHPVNGALPALTASPSGAIPLIQARVQTEGVARWGDAADDPAIWVHPSQPERSLVLGTNKKQGLLSYDLQGRQQQLLEAGRLNNVDVRQGVRLGGRTVDLAVATQRDEKALALFEIDGEGRMRDVGRVPSELQDIYGTCLYQPPEGGLEVIANDKDGRFVQIRLELQDGVYGGKTVRRFKLASQPEGCVVDDARSRLFVGEEDVGIWTLSAQAQVAAQPTLVMPVGPHLVADVEGLALYHGTKASYLVASSQGNSSFVVMDALPPYTYRGAFRVGLNPEAGIDGVSDTDGLEISAVNLGGPYSRGLVVVQDGYKRLPDGPQNFKLLSWDDVARTLELP